MISRAPEPHLSFWCRRHVTSVFTCHSYLKLGFGSTSKGCSTLRLWGELTATSQYLKGADRKGGEGVFITEGSDRKWGNGFKIKESRFPWHMKKKNFTARIMRHWNRLLRRVVDAPSLELSSWVMLWATWFTWRCLCSLQSYWTRWHFKVPSNPNYSMILWLTAIVSPFQRVTKRPSGKQDQQPKSIPP